MRNGACSRWPVTKENRFTATMPVETHLPRAIDNAHAAGGDLFEQFVSPNSVC